MKKILVSAVAAALALIPFRPAQAAGLWFVRVPVKNHQERVCLDFAAGTGRALGWDYVERQGNVVVAGQKDGAFIAITCIARGGYTDAMAVIMSSHDFDLNIARAQAEAASIEIQRYICVDYC